MICALLFLVDVCAFLNELILNESIVFLLFIRMRGKMRFWSKTKHGEKKLSREKQASTSEAGETHGKKKKHKMCCLYPLSVDLKTHACIIHTNTSTKTRF